MTSDKEYIEKIIKSYERRKLKAALFGVVAIIFGVTAYIIYVMLGEKTHDLVSSISSVLVEGRAIDVNDIKLIKTNNDLSYVMGLRVGQMINFWSMASGISLGYCIYFLFGARKELLIKELYEKEKI